MARGSGRTVTTSAVIAAALAVVMLTWIAIERRPRTSSASASAVAARGVDVAAPAAPFMRSADGEQASDSERVPVQVGVPPIRPAFLTYDFPWSSYYPRIAVEGRVTVEDATGAVIESVNGRFSLRSGSALSRAGTSVLVSAGRFVLDAPEAFRRRLRVGHGVFDGRRAVPLLPVLSVPDDGVVELGFRWQQECVLHVVAADTGVALPDARVIALEEYVDSGSVPAEEVAPSDLLASGPSPIVFGAEYWEDGGPRLIGVGADGYGWQRAYLPAAGGEQVVALEPAGELLVRLDRDVDWAATVVVLRAGGGRLERLAEGSPEFDSIHFRDLPAGLCRVDVLLEDQPPEVVARGVVQVPAHGTATLELPFPAEDPTELHGVLLVPAGWDLDDLLLDFLHVGVPGTSYEADYVDLDSMVNEGDGRYRWQVVLERPGEYLLRVLSANVEVPARTGDGPVEIALPPPARVLVEVDWGPAGADAFVETLWWRPRSYAAPESLWLEVDVEDGRAEFTTGPGEIEVAVRGLATMGVGQWGSEFVPAARARAVLEVRAGENRNVLEVEPACGVVLELRDGDFAVPWDPAWSPSLLRSGAPGRAEATQQHADGSLWVQVTGPGRYTFHPPPRGVHASPATVSFDVKAGEWQRVRVPLASGE